MFLPEDIPHTLHTRVKRILGNPVEEDYSSFLQGLKSEADVYINLKLDDGIELEPVQKRLAVTLYVQYSMFSRTENENIARDKIITLDGLLDACNQKYRSSKKENTKFIPRMRVF